MYTIKDRFEKIINKNEGNQGIVNMLLRKYCDELSEKLLDADIKIKQMEEKINGLDGSDESNGTDGEGKTGSDKGGGEGNSDSSKGSPTDEKGNKDGTVKGATEVEHVVHEKTGEHSGGKTGDDVTGGKDD